MKKTTKKTKAKKNPGGRPTKKDDLNFTIACNLAKRGLTLSEIAETIEVVESTIYLWLSKDKKFSEAIKEGKKVADSRVTNSLYKRANGYKYKEVKEESISIDHEGVKIPGKKITITTKEIAPDVTAQIFWLKNRIPQEWRDKQELELKTYKYDEFKETSDEELERKALELANRITERRSRTSIN